MKRRSTIVTKPPKVAAPSRRQALKGLTQSGLLVLGGLPLLSACVSLDLGGDPPQALQWALRDAAGGPDASARPAAPAPLKGPPLVAALLLQAQAADALLDSTAMAYSPRAGAFSAYHYASWTERPARQLQRLLQQRLLTANVAGAVAALGEPQRADWLLNIKLEELHHATQTLPGSGRVALQAVLFDRRSREQRAQRRFQLDVAATSADAAGAVQALSQALGQVFDQLVPWLAAELQRALVQAPAGKGGDGKPGSPASQG